MAVRSTNRFRISSDILSFQPFTDTKPSRLASGSSALNMDSLYQVHHRISMTMCYELFATRSLGIFHYLEVTTTFSNAFHAADPNIYLAKQCIRLPVSGLNALTRQFNTTATALKIVSKITGSHGARALLCRASPNI